MSNWNKRAMEIFGEAATSATAAERERFVAKACAGDAELRECVDSMFAAHDRADGFLELPATDVYGRMTSISAMAVGTTIGNYKILQEIGEGGFGIVFMAQQQQPVRRKVALKIIKPGMDTREVIARFEAERQALALMEHPNIAKVIDAGSTDDGRPYFVMELVNGVPITEFCDDNELSTRKRLELFVSVCRAVQHAHQKGVIHRDLKPSNVMVTISDGEPMAKVIDFGVAKAINQELTEKTLFTAFGQMVGTPQYMSPEQAQISATDVDTRSDVYSLGVLLFELMTGSTPLDGQRLRESGFEEMRRIIREEEPPTPSHRLSTLGEKLSAVAKHHDSDPSRLQSTVQGDIDWIVTRALDKDRNRRYETASDFADDVNRFLNDAPIEARPPSSLYQFQKFARRNRAMVIASLAVCAALLLGIIGTTAALIQANRESIRTQEANDRLDKINGQLRMMIYDQAVMDAMGGYEDKTQEAIAKLRVAGAHESQVELILGILNRSVGNSERALQHFTRSTDLDPANLPANCELLGTLIDQGDYSEFNRVKGRIFHEIESASPVTAQDYVAKGLAALYTLTPSWSLELIAQGRTIRDSPTFQLHHAVALAYKGFKERDLKALQQARNELVRVEARFGSDHRLVRRSTLLIARFVALVARRNGENVDESLLSYADECALDLMQDKVPLTLVTVAWYYDHVRNDLDCAEQAWKRACELSTGDLYHTLYTAFLLRRYGIDAALAEFGKANKRSVYSELMEAVLLSLEPNGQDRAEAIWKECADKDYQEGATAILIPLMLGDKEILHSAVERWGTHPTWAKPIFEYLLGVISEEDFLARGGRSRVPFYIGMKSLREGKREKAMHELKKLADVRFNLPFGYDSIWAAGILAEMNRRPDWPRLRPTGK